MKYFLKFTSWLFYKGTYLGYRCSNWKVFPEGTKFGIIPIKECQGCDDCR